MGRLEEFYGVSVDWLFGIGSKANYDLDGIPRGKNGIMSEMRVNIQQNI